jgi:hypothetical protein
VVALINYNISVVLHRPMVKINHNFKFDLKRDHINLI